MKTKILLLPLMAVILIVIAGFVYCNQNSEEFAEPFEYPEYMPLFDLKPGDDYFKEWKKVDSLARKGLNRSALKQVNSIYEKAYSTENYPQVAKCVISRILCESQFEEEAYVKAIYNLSSETDSAPEPLKRVLHSITADSYWMYYLRNRWVFYNRTSVTNYKLDDIRTWDLRKIVETCDFHYMKSLEEDSVLKRVPIDQYAAILEKGDSSSLKIRPTLYDFLAHRALRFYGNSESGLTQSADNFVISDDHVFGDVVEFVKTKLSASDSSQFVFRTYQLLKNLAYFHLADKEPEAQVDLELIRLQMMKSHSVSVQKDSLYLNALLKLSEKYQGKDPVAEVRYHIALQYNQSGSNYQPFQVDKNRFDKKKAVELCNSTIKEYPKAYGSNLCRQLVDGIKSKSFSVSSEQVIVPDQKSKLLINYSNLNQLYFRVCKIDNKTYRNYTRKHYGKEMISRLSNLKPELEWSKDMEDYGDFQNHATEIAIDPLKSGHYVLLGSSNVNFSYDSNAVSYGSFWASNIAHISRDEPNEGKYNFQLFHRENGTPLKGVKATVMEEKYNYLKRDYEYNKMGSYNSDENGFIELQNSKEYRNFYMDFSWEDQALATGQSYYQYRPYKNNDNYTYFHFFLDRSIYRPGQSVHFKAIALHYEGIKRELKKDYSQTVTFYDANWQVITTQDLRTNEFGTFSGTFNIPTGIMNGMMHLSTSNGSISFSVEEYKRPKFEATHDPLAGTFKLQDSVKVSGLAKSFSGAPVDGAVVKYRIVRQATFPRWCFWRYGYNPVSAQMEIGNGETKTNDDGTFDVTFKAIPDLGVNKKFSPTFTYTVYSDVTDLNGETQSTQSSVRIGYNLMEHSIQIPETLNNQKKDTFKISTTNLMGEKVGAKGSYEVFVLTQPTRVLRSRKWGRPDVNSISKEDYKKWFPNDIYDNEADKSTWKKTLVLNGQFNTEEKQTLVFKKFSEWKEGEYMIESKAKDADGNWVSDMSYFTVFSPVTSIMPAKTLNWSFYDPKTFEPGEIADFFIGSSEESVKVLYEVEHRNKIVSKEWVNLNKEKKKIELKIEEEHRGNVVVHFSMIKKNRVFTRTYVVNVPYTNKKLDLSFETFRNKLLPGQNEEWKIKIQGPNGDKVAAEMLASMYDASLDEFRSHSWNFNIYQSFYSSLGWDHWDSYSYSGSTLYQEKWNNYYYAVPRRYYHLRGYGLMAYSGYEGDYRYKNSQHAIGGNGYFLAGATMSDNMDYNMDIAESEEMQLSEVSVTKSSKGTVSKSVNLLRESGGENRNEGKKGEDDEKGRDKDGKPHEMARIKARSNFSETAFFYPQLKTDDQGNVLVTFTIPESLTKWKFKALAHTQDLKIGQLSGEAITQKDLMVVPNAPRFLRENDEIVFSSKITNLSEKSISGLTSLFLENAINEENIGNACIKASPEQSFTIEKGKSTLVKWIVKVPEAVGSIKYKVVAAAGKHTDGEEAVLPVLSNRMLVTESLPLPVRGKGTKRFEFTKLINSKSSKTLRNHKLTLEFTSNPAWYAIQALPYMMEYPYECAEQTFTRYYANSIASHIANSSPKIKAVFDSWKSSSPDAFLSNLEKNQELKALMLQETPWVLDAEDEQERKKRVALLFDLNKMSNELERAIKKVEKDQSSNGGWPWFPGMPESRYITQHIICGFGHLNHLGINIPQYTHRQKQMIEKGIKYLDQRIKEDYDDLIRYKVDMDKNHLGYTQIQYLYARSYFSDVDLYPKHKKAYDYYFGQAKKYWNVQGRYMQGMLALALHRGKEIETAKDIMASIKENALNNEEMGMYWKENYEGYYWYQAPIESQALMIEAFDEVTKDQESVEALKVWLLKSKQTQDWKTTKATSEACYALLLKGTDILVDNRPVKIKLGSMEVDPSKMDDVKVEAGTGYFKTSWSKTEIQPEWGKVEVTKESDGVAWGALYWQYFEQLDKITPAETPLKLKKALFKVVNSSTGPKLEPIQNGDNLNVGDKVKIRIELRVDRDMEYVHMKDMRASGFEPINVFSRYKWQDGLGYYESTKDASTNFFFDYLKKGTYVFEYPLWVSHSGDFSNGITSIQCMYAPEFGAHSEGVRVKVE